MNEQSPNLWDPAAVLSVLGQLLLRLACCMALAGCGSQSSEQLESNTNWLSHCGSDLDCPPGLSCRCDVCTETCETNSCPALLQCVGASACGDSSQDSCQLLCDGDADCEHLGNAAECRGGVCALSSGGLSSSDVSEPHGDDDSDHTSDDGNPHDAGSDEPINADSVVPCAELFPDLQSGQEPPGAANNAIASASIHGDELRIETLGATHCPGYDYAVCFRPGGESYPVGMNISLLIDTHDIEPCDGLNGTELSFDLTRIAEDYMQAYQSDGDIVQTPFGIYGFGEMSCEARLEGNRIEREAALDRVSLDCNADADCTRVNIDNGCTMHCGWLTSVESGIVLSETIDRIEENLCGEAYAAAGCDPPIPPPCVAQFEPRCVAGQCTDAAPSTADQCIQDNPADSATSDSLGSLLSVNGQDCAEVGVDDDTIIISANAAACIAQAEGLADGIEPWTISLVCNSRVETIVWAVHNTETRSDSRAGGTVMNIDAVDGTLIETLGWDATP